MWLQLQCCTLTRWDLVSINFKVRRRSEVHGKLGIEEMVSGMGSEVQIRVGGAEYDQRF